MPPVSERSSFIAVWVEDGQAKLWRIETNSGAMDEIARFAVEGMTRPAILELARLFIRSRGPQRSIVEDVTNGAAPGKRPVGRPRKDAAALTIAPARRGPRPRIAKADEGKSYAERRDAQMARQQALLEGLQRHPEGVIGTELGRELGRENPDATGVSLGVLARSGLARHDAANGKWFPATVDVTVAR